MKAYSRHAGRGNDCDEVLENAIEDVASGVAGFA